MPVCVCTIFLAIWSCGLKIRGVTFRGALKRHLKYYLRPVIKTGFNYEKLIGTQIIPRILTERYPTGLFHKYNQWVINSTR